MFVAFVIRYVNSKQDGLGSVEKIFIDRSISSEALLCASLVG